MQLLPAASLAWYPAPARFVSHGIRTGAAPLPICRRRICGHARALLSRRYSLLVAWHSRRHPHKTKKPRASAGLGHVCETIISVEQRFLRSTHEPQIQKPRWSGGACYVTSWYATYQAFLLYRRILVPSSRAEDDGLEP